MERQDWDGYVQKVTHGEFPVPQGMVSDMDNWLCRSTVGRVLYFLGDIEGAMDVLSTVLKIKPDVTAPPPAIGLSEVEHMVLCLRDTAELVWQLTHTDYAPLLYLQRACGYCRTYPHPFRSASRGGIWYRRLQIMRESGKAAAAEQAARAELAANGQADGVDQYKFFACVFLAEAAAAAGDYARGADLLAEAYRYYPRNAQCEADLQAAAQSAAAVERYHKYYACTQNKYAAWEKAAPAAASRE